MKDNQGKKLILFETEIRDLWHPASPLKASLPDNHFELFSTLAEMMGSRVGHSIY